MQLDILTYLLDIQNSIESINEYLGENRNFNDYLSNKLLRRGIERELEIIGEAANRILKIDQSIAIDNARKIVDLRNWVIHGYDKVDDVIIWGIVSQQLPTLKEQVDKLLIDNT
ncbi:MAG: HepT-like ribonuclease domain-containing protein [bacterium]